MALFIGPGATAIHGDTSLITCGQYHTLGERARDTAGNEFVYVDFQQIASPGQWMVFNDGYLATPLVASTSRGRVGIVAGNPDASDRFGWLQVYGKNVEAQIDSSAATSASILSAPTTLTTEGYPTISVSDSSSEGNRIYGAWAQAAATTAVTTPSTQIEVMLNYPYVLGYAHSFAS